MVTGNYSYEEQTRRRLSEAKTKKHAMDEQSIDLQKAVFNLGREITAYETILEGFVDDTQLNWKMLLRERTRLILFVPLRIF